MGFQVNIAMLRSQYLLGELLIIDRFSGVTDEVRVASGTVSHTGCHGNMYKSTTGGTTGNTQVFGTDHMDSQVTKYYVYTQLELSWKYKNTQLKN